jgi:hypothetical protein
VSERTLKQQISDAKVRAVVGMVRRRGSIYQGFGQRLTDVLRLFPTYIEKAGEQGARHFTIHYSYIPQGDFILMKHNPNSSGNDLLRVFATPEFKVRQRSFTEFLMLEIRKLGLGCRPTYDGRIGNEHYSLMVTY